MRVTPAATLRRLAPFGRRPDTVRGAVLQFAISGLLVLVLLGALAVFALRQQGREESIRDARVLTESLGRGVVQPHLADGLLSGAPDALAELDRIVRLSVLSEQVVRVKIWSPEGRIVYSDEPQLIGSTYPLGEEELEALAAGLTQAELTSNLSKPENRFERSYSELLEVYLPLVTPGGQRLLFETYQQYDDIRASGRKIWLDFVPALVVALVLLWLVQLPLAVSLARRVRDSQRERESLLRQAIESSDTERRRIASDLHDGVVQDLAGFSYSLAATAAQMPARESSTEAVAALRSASAGARQIMRHLRSLIVEIYPPNLESVGLASAIADLAAPLVASDLEVELAVPTDNHLPASVEALLYRGANEALRNITKHADAKRIEVRVEHHDGFVRLVVEDDGRGFSAEGLAERQAAGHVGLRLLGDLAERAGGTLEVRPSPGVGTRVQLEVPTT